MRVTWTAAAAAMLLAAPAAAQTPTPPIAATARLPVRSGDDLPRHSYPIAGKATTWLTEPTKGAALAAAVRRNVQATLARYDVQDRATLRRLHQDLLNAAVVLDDRAQARREVAILRELQDKERAKALTGLRTLAYLDALEAGPIGSAGFSAAFRRVYSERLNALPYALVGEAIAGNAGFDETVTPALELAAVERDIQPLVDSGGALDDRRAGMLLEEVFYYRIDDVLIPDRIPVELAYVQANRRPKPDIWAARAAVPPTRGLTPVTVAIWDGGLDPAVFPGRVWTNPRERVNGLDDDGNGLVDDLYGPSFDANGRPEPGVLDTPPAAMADGLAQLAVFDQGRGDQQALIRSAEAAQWVAFSRAATPAQLAEAADRQQWWRQYSHGTHVAGIAAAGNPAIRMLSARLLFDWRSPPRRPTEATARAWAAMHQRTVDYFKAAGVRVVNMSWGIALKLEYEDALAANGVPPAERAAEARRLFAIDSEGLRQAIASAPDILFVCGAGNDDDSAAFSGTVPSSIEAPNVLTVAGVDQAGDPMGISSGGPTIDLAANGYQVESFIPGGKRARKTGTSMASPQVVNVAAKLLAVRPDLTVAQLRDALVSTATPGPGGAKLLNGKAALAKGQAPPR